MNNLKEKIEKALDKCDVVVLSGVSGVGKTRMLTELVENYVDTDGRYLSSQALINNSSYSVIKNTLKTKDFFVIDDVSSKQLQATINRIQEAVAKTNKKCKVVIATDSYSKDKANSAVLKIKHYKMVKHRYVFPKIKEVQELLKSIEEQKFITDKVQVSCLNDLYQMEQQLKYSMDLNEKYECEAVLHDHNYTQLSLDLDDSKAENEDLIKENYSLHLKIKELNDLLYDQNEEKIELEGSIQELEQSLSVCQDKIQTYKNTIAVFEDKAILLQKANSELESYLNEKVYSLKEELNNEAEETAFFKEMSEDFITQIKWLNNTIEVYRGEVDEDTIRRVEYTVQQLRESFGDDYEV
ncbi:AAA family ATPase [Escherichia coli]|uniref:nSTAND3 domain-containing NTPase n=1 Tax=Escherichia coli TaxID=562 RepID=UPI000BB8C63E|nr:AAA family ATPase [Escherichia coli]EIX9709525.1 AAA family ATPase [Klebsiella pneumoniae]MGW43774.1 AAA family ATPase [Salmonella enterica subsp. enterica serovar Anatum]PBU46705.1 AAA family ATPase [Escherichia coli]PBU51356.1 AAA family ATPase [Escherichia coli]PBU89585.1 AAA family ATPase [Escherichia coli]